MASAPQDEGGSNYALCHVNYAQYTPPTPTRLNCRVESRRRRVGVGGVY